MERPIFQPVGTPVEQLDTPALVLDLDVMDRNIKTFQGYFADALAKQRLSNVCSHIADPVRVAVVFRVATLVTRLA